MQERRCAQIAELLAQGVKGVALTSAVQAWDKESGASPGTDGVFVAEPGVVATAKTSRVRTRAKTDPQVVPVQVDARAAARYAARRTPRRRVPRHALYLPLSRRASTSRLRLCSVARPRCLSL
jgi:hypothetical protein